MNGAYGSYPLWRERSPARGIHELRCAKTDEPNLVGVEAERASIFVEALELIYGMITNGRYYRNQLVVHTPEKRYTSTITK